MPKKRKNNNYHNEYVTNPTGAAVANSTHPAAKKIIISAVAVALIAALIVGIVMLTDKTGKMGVGASEYYGTRDVLDRDISYAEFCVEGYGRFVVLLDATTAPETVANFKKLVNEGFYNGLTFHRVIEGFMIQGGDPKADGTGGSDARITGEFSANGHPNDISHKRGVISMAREGNYYNPAAAYNTASSQFFICNDDATTLDGDYAAFGYVVEGMSVIDDITEKTAGHGDSNGTIANKSKQARIKYVKLLDSYEG